MKETYTSVSEVLKVIISIYEFLVSNLQRQVGARLFMNLYSKVVVSPFRISSIEGHYNIDSKGEAKAS